MNKLSRSSCFTSTLFLNVVLICWGIALTGCGGDSDSKSKRNLAPIPVPSVFNAQADTALEGQLSASDREGDALSYSLLTQAENGEVSISNDGSFTYTPDELFLGNDSFGFRVSDGKRQSTSSVSITVGLKNVLFSEYSRQVFNQSAVDKALDVNTRNIEKDVVAEDAYDDLLMTP